jgi:hypothetical protein
MRRIQRFQPDRFRTHRSGSGEHHGQCSRACRPTDEPCQKSSKPHEFSLPHCCTLEVMLGTHYCAALYYWLML